MNVVDDISAMGKFCLNYYGVATLRWEYSREPIHDI